MQQAILLTQQINIIKQYENQESEKYEVPTSSETTISSEIELSSPSKITIIKKSEMPEI